MNSPVVLWTTTLIMMVGGLLILARGRRRTASEGLHTVLHGIVPIIAACSYLAMAMGQGLVVVPSGNVAETGANVTRIFYFARYVDWLITTPLLLIGLGMSAMHSGHKRSGIIAGAVLADLIMIVTAFAFGASEAAWMKWTWFIVSCAAFLGVFYVLWLPQAQANALERDDIRSAYIRNASILSVIWLVYPLILAVDADGLNIVDASTGVLVIAILDVLAKVVYGLMTVASDTRATDRDLADHDGTAKIRVAA